MSEASTTVNELEETFKFNYDSKEQSLEEPSKVDCLDLNKQSSIYMDNSNSFQDNFSFSVEAINSDEFNTQCNNSIDDSNYLPNKSYPFISVEAIDLNQINAPCNNQIENSYSLQNCNSTYSASTESIESNEMNEHINDPIENSNILPNNVPFITMEAMEANGINTYCNNSIENSNILPNNVPFITMEAMEANGINTYCNSSIENSNSLPFISLESMDSDELNVHCNSTTESLNSWGSKTINSEENIEDILSVISEEIIDSKESINSLSDSRSTNISNSLEENNLPVLALEAIDLALTSIKDDNNSDNIFNKDFVPDLDDIINDSLSWADTVFPNDYSNNDSQNLHMPIQNQFQKTFPMYRTEQDSSYTIKPDLFTSNFLNSLQENNNENQLDAGPDNAIQLNSPSLSGPTYPISSSFLRDYEPYESHSANKYLYSVNHSPQFNYTYPLCEKNKMNYNGKANNFGNYHSFPTQFEPIIPEQYDNTNYSLPFSPNTLFQNDPFLHSNQIETQKPSGSLDESLLSSISQDTPPSPSVIYIDAYASERESTPVNSNKQDFENFEEDNDYDNEILDPTVSCYTSKPNSPISSSSKDYEAFQMDSDENTSSEDSDDYSRGRRNRRNKSKKDKTYKRSIKFENNEIGVRTRRMTSMRIKNNNVHEKRKVSLQRKRKHKNSAKMPPSLMYRSLIKEPSWAKSRPILPYTVNINPGKSKHSRTVRQLLAEKSSLKFLESLQQETSAPLIKNDVTSIEMDGITYGIPMSPLNNCNVNSNADSPTEFEQPGPSEPMRMSSLRTGQTFVSKEHRPRHFPFLQLFIGKFEVVFRKAKGKKNSNKIKILFSKKQFVYEFEHPFANMEKKMACVVVPFRTITAMRYNANEISIAIDTQPFSYLSINNRKSPGIYRAHTYDTEHNVDVTYGELATTVVHKIFTETDKQASKIKIQLMEFDSKFKQVYKNPIPLQTQAYLKTHSFVENKLTKKNISDVSQENDYLIKNASRVCSCRMSCRSIRCSCVKAKRKCNANRSVCYCTNCDNPLNILESCGILLNYAMKDPCLMHSVYQIPDLIVYIRQEIKLSCCNTEVALFQCIPGLVRCPNAFCRDYVYYSWCQEKSYHATQFPPNHCMDCNKCCIPNQKHCMKCHQGFIAEQPNACCPYCGQDFL